MFNLFELRISCYDACPLVQCSSKRETVGVRDAVLGLILRGPENEAVRNGKYGFINDLF